MSQELFYHAFLEWLREDNPYWDLTTSSVLTEPIAARARVVCKERNGCVVACTEEVSYALRRLGLRVEALAPSGSRVREGDEVLVYSGDARLILETERVVLNTLIYASSIATYTRLVVERVRRINPRIRVAATRKTVPGFRLCSKRAVLAGGGDTHRLSLSDAILVKDNHATLVGSIGEAVRRAKRLASFAHRVEAEVHSVEEAVEAVLAGADAILVDNQPPETVERILEELRRRGLRDRVIIEVSGGVTLENIEEYARLDIDVISMGLLTMPPIRVDMSLTVERTD